MQHTEDIVWDAITDSAKTRFDYQAFERVFSDTGSSHLPENVLFLTIVGHAAEHSPDEIVADINRELALLGIGVSESDLRDFVTERRGDLKREVLATMTARALFEQGAKPPGVLVQVRSILERTNDAA
jgi:hypothetical protein